MNNYQKQLKQISQLNGRASLLIHICCGVCSVYPLRYLSRYFKVSAFFSNSNIYPYEEFLKRLQALQTSIDRMDGQKPILIVDDYDNGSYNDIISVYGDLPEGDRRCYLCYRLRMEKAFRYALAHDYEYCTTVMSISNRKNADWLNEIGEELEKKYRPVKYLHADFKKGDGINENERLNRQLDLYHQDYCGCIYSLNGRKHD